jgi:hypothetical protein
MIPPHWTENHKGHRVIHCLALLSFQHGNSIQGPEGMANKGKTVVSVQQISPSVQRCGVR